MILYTAFNKISKPETNEFLIHFTVRYLFNNFPKIHVYLIQKILSNFLESEGTI